MNSDAKDVRDGTSTQSRETRRLHASRNISTPGHGKAGTHSGFARFAPALAALAFLSVTGAASAQMYTPVHIKNSGEIKDEFGAVVKGSAAVHPSKRSLVQFLWASNSVINPPAYDGTPHPDNAPVENGRTAIGNLVSPALLTPGRFSASLSEPRPPQNGRIFVRVFNGPTLEESSFYADSQVMRVNNNDVLIANIGDTTNPIDPRDFDGDGLVNSWEDSLDSDPNDWDTDDDGVSDYHEFLAGTDLHDDRSFFAAVWLTVDEAGHNARLTWASVRNKRYQVQYTTGINVAQPVYTDVGEVITATNEFSEMTITGGMSSGAGLYRVKLVQD